MQTAWSLSGLAGRFDDLQDRAGRRPRQASVDIPSDLKTTSKASIGRLKDFYVQRLAKGEHGATALLCSQLSRDSSPRAGELRRARPTFTQAELAEVEELDVMCNNCFNLIKSSEASMCTGEPSSCPLSCRSGAPAELPAGPTALADLKLRRLRAALEARLEDSNAKVTIMKHLMQLRYHVDAALKWSPGCSEIGVLTEHTVAQVRQLTTTSRVIAPAVHVFSKRIENAVVQKDRALRRGLMEQSSPLRAVGTENAAARPGHQGAELDDDGADSVVQADSVVSALESDCGSAAYDQTVVTQEAPSSEAMDIGNIKDVSDPVALNTEDEKRRWFYSQCLNAKLACQDKERARKVLISELYTRARAEGVPMQRWVPWIRSQLGD